MPNRFWPKLVSILFGGLSVLTLFLTPLRASELPLVRIGIVIDGPWERNDEIGEILSGRDPGTSPGGSSTLSFPRTS